MEIAPRRKTDRKYSIRAGPCDAEVEGTDPGTPPVPAPTRARISRRTRLLLVGLPVAVVAVALVLILANQAQVPGPPTTLPIPAGTRYEIRVPAPAAYQIFPIPGGFVVPFRTASVATLVGAWTSDGPLGTAIYWANFTNLNGMNATGAMGCSLTYDVTLTPGSYTLKIATQPVLPPYSVNWTVTQTIRLVPPAGSVTPVSRWEGPAAPCG